MKPLSQRTVRTTIGMMRSMANCKPISLFHIMAAKEMEQLLEEVLEYRKGKNERAKHLGKGTGLAKASDDSSKP
jgi:flagellar motor switch protein FliG